MIRVVAAAFLLGYGGLALAYRPFDSTDADVAHAGEAEIEFGPLQWLKQDSKRFLQAPALIANIGFSKDRELVVEGRRQVALDREGDEPRTALVDDAVSLKQVLRRGVLQEEGGVSVATEYGVLLPEVNGEHGTGFSLAGIVSQRGTAGTVHLNAALARTRDHEDALFLGTILEGPIDWTLRPVAEAFAQRATGGGRLDSLLLGAIWRVREGLSFDAGVRSARTASETIHELRLGLTWAFSLKGGR